MANVLTIGSASRISVCDGAPVNGTSGTLAGIAGKGWLLIDSTNGLLYVNTNTQASPTWSQEADATGAALAGVLNGVQVANVAESNVIGGIPQTFEIPITAGALGNTDITVTHKIRVLDAYLILRGAGVATTTLQVFNGASAITDAMAASGSNKAIVRAATIDSATYEIAAGGTLRVTSATGATQPNALVVVTAVRIA